MAKNTGNGYALKDGRAVLDIPHARELGNSSAENRNPNRLVRTNLDYRQPRPQKDLKESFAVEITNAARFGECEVGDLYVYGTEEDLEIISDYPGLDLAKCRYCVTDDVVLPNYMYIQSWPLEDLYKWAAKDMCSLADDRELVNG